MESLIENRIQETERADEQGNSNCYYLIGVRYNYVLRG
jgi:hypothetical protein